MDIVNTTCSNDIAPKNTMAKKPYNFRFEEKLIEQVQKLADKDNRTLTNFIETLLMKVVEDSKKKKAP
jgi:predicted HicB family RNase H-like nuclease